jgi:hypothetical protein
LDDLIGKLKGLLVRDDDPATDVERQAKERAIEKWHAIAELYDENSLNLFPMHPESLKLARCPSSTLTKPARNTTSIITL